MSTVYIYLVFTLKYIYFLNKLILFPRRLKFCFLYITGIFAYLNYVTPKTRKEILDLLINGLKRLEYRGYDSAGKIFTLYFAYNMYPHIVHVLCSLVFKC